MRRRLHNIGPHPCPQTCPQPCPQLCPQRRARRGSPGPPASRTTRTAATPPRARRPPRCRPACRAPGPGTDEPPRGPAGDVGDRARRHRGAEQHGQRLGGAFLGGTWARHRHTVIAAIRYCAGGLRSRPARRPGCGARRRAFPLDQPVFGHLHPQRRQVELLAPLDPGDRLPPSDCPQSSQQPGRQCLPQQLLAVAERSDHSRCTPVIGSKVRVPAWHGSVTRAVRRCSSAIGKDSVSGCWQPSGHRRGCVVSGPTDMARRRREEPSCDPDCWLRSSRWEAC